MISDRDIWASALLMVKRYGEDAGMEAAKRSDEFLAEAAVVNSTSRSSKGVGQERQPPVVQ